MDIAISSGHGKYVRGAKGFLDEVDEARLIVERVGELLRSAGIGCKTFHDNTSTSVSANLNAICNWHNAQKRDYDHSGHLNAYQSTSKPMGTECLYVTQEALARKLSGAMAASGKFINRGPKYRTDLRFLNSTSKPATLLEICFVDSSADANLYRENFEPICRAIAEAIGDVKLPVEPSEPGEPPPEPGPEPEPPVVEPPVEPGDKVVVSISAPLNNVTVMLNGQELETNPSEDAGPSTPVIPSNQTNIICTVFGGVRDPNDSAYPPYDTITDTELSVALPWKFKGDRPKVAVINCDNGKGVICDIRDVGPWLTDDDFFNTGERPLAETCYLNKTPLPRGPNKGKIPNGAGLDLTPAAAKAINLDGKGTVDFFLMSDDELMV